MRKLFTIGGLLLALGMSAQTTLPTSWNFSSPGITSPPAGWTLMNTLPNSTGGQTYAFGIGDALSCRFDAQGEYLTINFTEAPGPLSYYVSPQNAGNAWNGLFEVQESDNGTTWTNVRSFTTQATTATNFTNGKNTDNNLKATSRFVRFILTTKTTGNFALDSVLLLPAPPSPLASINVKMAGNAVVSGSTAIVGKTASTTFTIENKGTTQALSIDSVVFEGDAGTDFTATAVPAPVAGGASGNLVVGFSPGDMGSRIAQMKIYSNDAAKSPYTIRLYGIGGNLASEPTQQPTTLAFNNVKSYGYDLSFAAPAAQPEKYIVLFKRSGPVTEEPVDGHTYMRGDYIGGAQVAYLGDSAAKLHPTYIFANSSYFYKVFSYNGPAGFENYLSAAPLSGNVTTPNGNPGTYYAGLNSGSASFLTSLSAKINPHDTVFYSQYILKLVNPFLTRDTSGGKKVVNCVYTSLPYVYDEPFLWWNGNNGASLTREHTYAQSWMPTRNVTNFPSPNGKELPEYNDLHHLFPADQIEGNGKRSNYPFGEVVNVTSTSSTGQGKLGTDINGNTVWEPRDEQKGNTARALFYMCVTYNGISGNNWQLPAGQDQAVLKKWHFQDLPDAYEIARNEYIASVQHNRNPFIDSVNYVCRIDFSNMTWIATPPANCGIVQRSLTITAPVGGESIFGGSSSNITWNSSNVDSVKIELLVEDTLYSKLATVSGTAGTYSWTAPMIVTSKAKIRLTANTGSTVSSSPAYFSIANRTGINEAGIDKQVKVYPNPSAGSFVLSFEGGKAATCSIFDATGRLVKSLDVKAAHTAVELTQKGVYFMQVSSEGYTTYRKIVVE